MFSSLSDTAPETVTLADLRMFVSEGMCAEQVDRIRAETDKMRRQALKRRLPCVTVSGEFAGGHRAEHLVRHSGLLCVDFDAADNACLEGRAEEWRDRLAGDAAVALAFVSASGNGVAAVCRIEPERHAESFDALCGHFCTAYGLEADRSGRDVSRLRYLSHDPGVAENPAARVFLVRAPVEPPKPERQRTGLLCAAAPALTEERCEEILSALARLSPDDRKVWLDVGMAIHSEAPGLQGYNLWRRWSKFNDTAAKFDEQDLERVWHSFKRSGIGIGTLFKLAYNAGWTGLRTPACAPRAEAPRAPDAPDPGPMPDSLLRVPGFAGEVTDYCLETAPYPNPVMAFAGALALLAFLAGRKVRDSGDNRTNLYLLGLAHSAAGKDWPRKVNMRIAYHAGLAECLGERFASGEGIQDALFQTPCMLFQTDEIDGMLQSINKDKDARHEAIMSTLLTMYSSAGGVYPMRRKAGKESPGVIDQPNLVVFGTAIPNHYYGALSERMLTNGFFARMIILEAGPRGKGQEPVIRDPPPSVLATARWWADFRPGTGLRETWNPAPVTVGHTDEAKRLLIETRERAEAEYTAAESRGDPVGTTVWGRVSEQVRKLALLYAVSENHLNPRIGLAAVEWASAFMMHQTRRMLFMAAGHVADNPFHADCLKIVEKLRAAPGNGLPHSVLLKRMKMDAKNFSALIDTLCQQGDIELVTEARPGWNARSYRLAGGVNHGGENRPGGET